MEINSSPSRRAQDLNIRNFYLNNVHSRQIHAMSVNHNNTVIKFTKLPEYDFDSKVQWPRRNSYVLQPHLRRIVTLNEEDEFITNTTRSLKSELASPHKLMSSVYSKRKIITIAEDDKESIPLSSKRTVSGRLQAPGGSDAKLPTRSTSRNNVPARYSNKIDTKLSAKNISLSSSKINNETKNIRNSRIISKSQTQENISLSQEKKKDLAPEKEKLQVYKKTYYPKKNTNNIGKNINKQGNLGINAITNDLSASNRSEIKTNIINPLKRRDFMKSHGSQIIMVPIEDAKTTHRKQPLKKTPFKNASSQVTILDRDIISQDKFVETLLEPVTVDVDTETDFLHIEKHSVSVQTVNYLKSHFDSLDIPNVTLINNKDESEEDVVELCKDLLPNLKVSTSETIKEEDYEFKKDKYGAHTEHLPNLKIPDMEITLYKKINDESKEVVVKQCVTPIPDLQMPELSMTPHKENKHFNKLEVSKSQSYIIGHGTVTYTTKQKIDFHLVSNKEDAVSSTSSSPLAYPLNIVSIFKEEVNKSQEISETIPEETQKKKKHENSENVSQLVNCSYAADSNKLMKPSEIISTIRLNDGLLQSDYVCEQFQRELNFIDSFFESLQYLENCSLSNKSFTDASVENWVSRSGFDVNVIGPEYKSLFSKFGTNIDDTETMASKSLCLLNLLIRDEQRRANNLLFVLKMREDALKDFTKSQILWLENKKKHENIDISTLKKKQRGALLKLQHECGEMQRMRKALLALSEKRKVALMKTKKNIELKLKNNVTVEQILLSKKKLKRNSISDRPATPLKCFDLSSSGCDESNTSRAQPEPAVASEEPAPRGVAVGSADKSIQAGDCLLDNNLVDEATNTPAAESFVTVDGGYLNILFNHFSLPEIFSQGKSYEVNEEAIRGIVKSANSQIAAKKSDFIERYINQLKQRDQDRSTTPSTARSLVEEFDHYYKGLTEEDQSLESSVSKDIWTGYIVDSVEIATGLNIPKELKVEDTKTLNNIVVMAREPKNQEVLHDVINASTTTNVISMSSKDIQTLNDKEITTPVATKAGPLPVPAGAAAATDASLPPDVPVFTSIPQTSTIVSAYDTTSNITEKLSTTDSCNSSISSYIDPLVVSPVHNEAEELRRQQLAIEREIKALEQQQCQLLVLREIPDKPPPPYIPPAGARTPKPTQRFAPDDTIEEKVEKYLISSGPEHHPTDPFDLFLSDYCQESAKKHRKEPSDKPWDACNLLPQKPPLSQKSLVQITSAELKEVLKGVNQPIIVSNVGTRRSDHIDDILLAEWRRYEPKWTALHADEAAVKNQLFESIFQNVLAKTVDEYKKIIQRDCQVTDSE